MFAFGVCQVCALTFLDARPQAAGSFVKSGVSVAEAGIEIVKEVR